MDESMVSGESIAVLVERISGVVDDIKEMKGKVDAMHVVHTRVANLERDVVAVDRKADVALGKTDRIDDALDELRKVELEPIKVEIAGARRAWKWVASLGSLLFLAAGGLYSQWHPWADDIAKAKDARDAQLARWQDKAASDQQSNDRRLTVLEFRVGNVDGKTNK
ncbi:hypothetical protein [Burkholderia gladioli]|uniref:hypothetical protein n=1 Tax=Burkholderia gladioli TaxID=28095 RepID=UPI00163EC202|nr:hypothetical protein [Burkholderia gladioli]